MVLDGHADLLWDVRRRRKAGQTRVLERMHLPALRRGLVEGLVLSLWTHPEKEGGRFSALLDLFAALDAEARETPALRVVRTAREARAARLAGATYLFLAVEGIGAVGEDLDLISHLARLGVRMGSLTWNEENLLAAGAGGDPAAPLTALGRSAVKEMWRCGMAVDVSHLNEAGFWSVLHLEGGRILASHSNCRALCDVPRNLTDDQLRAVAAAGGTVGLNAYHGFVHRDPQYRTAEMLARHAAHMADVMGAEHVACGFDFGWYMGDAGALEIGCAQEIPAFFRELARIGFSAEERRGIARENLLRVLG